MSSSKMHIESFFDSATFTFSHLLADLSTRQCALIDSVLDYDPKSGRTSTTSAMAQAKYAKQLPKLNLFKLEDAFGDWDKVAKDHFADGGSFDQIYLKK